ncbi:MAG: helix-turn-helix domain-containing protein [Natronospirillum sp.]|uniref:GlxA family transcriptional regulator n=1 Tax=Natronospirillum sp. TaxID=2812955 RepID=UPI0025F57F7F|nr:helix-turn-helix domain-containing protein [Natronospirillum sp.]MCH8552343.1 helix-turn-helix domain-containing protein [Natronospirillum sp.]
MKIGFVALPRTLATGITLPCEMLQAAAQLAQARGFSGPTPAFQVLAQDGLGEQVAGGLHLRAQGHWTELLACDHIFVPPLWGNPLPMLRRFPDLVANLAQAARRDIPIVATGTGVCLLAESGTLDQRVATTHWYYFSRFTQRYPQVLLRPRQSITWDRDIFCAGSVNALTDLVLYFIRTWYDEDIMGVIERHFSHEVSRTLSQPYYRLGGLQHDDEDIVAAQAWLLDRLDKPFSLQQLAQAVGLSSRTLSRRFVNATGESPKQYWLQLRLLRAEEMLRETNLSVQDIAELLGFSDASYFIRLFRQRAGVTPNDYRRVSRAKQFSVHAGWRTV